MVLLYNKFMSNAKTPVEEVKVPPQNPFSRFSKFGGQQSKFGGGPKFNPKGIVVRPTFVTQHKGGGGK
jgi:hypothetical protein